jgi:hypothetical protein
MNKPSRKEIDAEISRIYNKNGGITPDLVIKAAEDPNNVLHHLLNGTILKRVMLTGLIKLGRSSQVSRSI